MMRSKSRRQKSFLVVNGEERASTVYAQCKKRAFRLDNTVRSTVYFSEVGGSFSSPQVHDTRNFSQKMFALNKASSNSRFFSHTFLYSITSMLF